jgi:hypothetical protein
MDIVAKKKGMVWIHLVLAVDKSEFQTHAGTLGTYGGAV